jgi:hypothetical protein
MMSASASIMPRLGCRGDQREDVRGGVGFNFGISLFGTTEFIKNAGEWIEWKASPPRRTPDRELRKARRALTAAASRFLERCRKEGLLSKAEFSEVSRDLDSE